MARPFVAGFMLGAAVMLITGAAIGIHAEDVSAEVLEAAGVAHVDPIALAGAVNTTGVDPWTYLRGVGELPPSSPAPRSVPPPPAPAVSARVNCIITHESEWDAHAVNPRSGAAGLGQFLASTWRSTPQGRAGLSVFSPDANRAAIEYMLDAGRAREFDAVRFYGC